MTVSCTQAPPTHKGETEIAGQVTRDGSPVAGAYVRLKGADDEFTGEVRADDDGRFQFFLAAGKWSVVCLAPGAAREEASVELNAGEKVEVKFEVSAAGA